jgi:hypothetical protein
LFQNKKVRETSEVREKCMTLKSDEQLLGWHMSGSHSSKPDDEGRKLL